MSQLVKMKSLFVLLLLSGGIALGQEESVSIQVFYESLCPDSIAWMETQLTPTWAALSKYITVDFNPFGKASFEATPEGGWSFTCQHGPNECYGNLWQACLLDKLEDNAVEVESVLCIMASVYPPIATRQCMTDLDITEPSFEAVSECQGTVEGENLLKVYGEATLAEIPPVTWLPWVKINNEYVEEDFDALQHDLLNHLCTKYLASVPECSMTK